jgi:hypothetical protein
MLARGERRLSRQYAQGAAENAQGPQSETKMDKLKDGA